MFSSLIGTADQEKFPYQAKSAVDTDYHVLRWFWKPQSRAFQRYQNHINWPSGCWDIANSLLWPTRLVEYFAFFDGTVTALIRSFIQTCTVFGPLWLGSSHHKISFFGTNNMTASTTDILPSKNFLFESYPYLWSRLLHKRGLFGAR